MKLQFFKWVYIAIFGLVLTACSENQSTVKDIGNSSNLSNVQSNTQNNGPKLSKENQKLAESCAKYDLESCNNLRKNLLKECQQNNAQSCVDSAVIYIKLYEEAIKTQNKKLTYISYETAINNLVKACELNNQEACNSLQELANNIFNNLKTVEKLCKYEKNKEACQMIEKAKKILDISCENGNQQDCNYRKQL